jgi:outer membrane lipoprotein-sorting protein
MAAGVFALAVSQAMAAPDLRSLVSPIKDFSSTVTATQVNTDELVKISDDYARAYKIKTNHVYYKSPGHIKVDSSIGPLKIVYVINGNKKSVKYGFIKKDIDVTDKPGQKQSLLDFGILTADQLADYTWKFVREETVKGAPLDVFELRFKNIKEDPSRRLIWVDPVHKVVVRRQTYHQFRDNVLKHDMRFEGLKRVGKVWVPTIIKVYNADGKLGATSKQSNIKINKGLSLSLFKV